MTLFSLKNSRQKKTQSLLFYNVGVSVSAVPRLSFELPVKILIYPEDLTLKGQSSAPFEMKRMKDHQHREQRVSTRAR